jgi:DNA-directed RNA polymerase specialized sigma24 family protein
MSEISGRTAFFGLFGRSHTEPTQQPAPTLVATPPSVPGSPYPPRPAPAEAGAGGQGPQAVGATDAALKAIITMPTGGGSKPTRQRVTKEFYFTECLKADFNEVRDFLRLGHIAHLWCSAQPDYEAAIDQLREYNRSGNLDGNALRTREQIACWHVSELFDRETVLALRRSTIRKLVPLIKRDTKTHAWSIRPTIENEARALVKRSLAEHWNVVTTSQEVCALVNPRKRVAKKPDRAARLHGQLKRLPLKQRVEFLQTQFVQLPSEQQAQLLCALQANLDGKSAAA